MSTTHMSKPLDDEALPEKPTTIPRFANALGVTANAASNRPTTTQTERLIPPARGPERWQPESLSGCRLKTKSGKL